VLVCVDVCVCVHVCVCMCVCMCVCVCVLCGRGMMSSSCSHVTTHANRLSEDALVKTQIGLCIYKAKLVRHWTQRKSAETYNRCFVFVPFTFRCQKDLYTLYYIGVLTYLAKPTSTRPKRPYSKGFGLLLPLPTRTVHL
jgi:hypothetical protein